MGDRCRPTTARALEQQVKDLDGTVTWRVRTLQSPLPRIDTVTLPGRLFPERLEDIVSQRLIDARNRVLEDAKALPGPPIVVISYKYRNSGGWTGSLFDYDYLSSGENQ